MLIGNSLDSSNLIEGTKSSESSDKLEEELGRFLNLLVTQLKNQDPLDPLDANEFTAQLVAFAGVEQQIFANANLEKLLKLEQTNQISALVDFIGSTVEATGRTVPLQDGQAEIGYTMPFGTNTATLTITNSAGLTVFQGDADTSSGKHVFAWDGKNNSGILQPDGAYYVMADISAFGYPNDVAFADFLVEEIGIAVVPGSSFYSEAERGSQQVRFAFCKRIETLEAAASRFAKLT